MVMKMNDNPKPPLLTPIELPGLTLPNRVVMSPMTRGRVKNDNGVPTDLQVAYYSQRATAGLIITEGTWVNEDSIGIGFAPGIYTAEQAKGWRKVTDAVHEKGGTIFIQLGHLGALAHPDYLQGRLPLGPSAIAIDENVFTPTGPKPAVVPKEMSADDIKRTIDDYRKAANLAMDAGFHGVEIHAHAKSLISQFFNDSLNERTDEYGGSIENKTRLLFDVIEAVNDVVGAARIGVRLNMAHSYASKSMLGQDMTATYDAVLTRLNFYNLAYLHLLGNPAQQDATANVFASAREWYKGNIIANGGLTFERANQLISDGIVDMASFAKPFIANPDLVYRFEHGLPLNSGDPATYYRGDEKGYIDYPTAADLQLS
jgi:N-ethylmaleimide reductase